MPATADNKHSAQGQRRTFLLLVSMFICLQVIILALAFCAWYPRDALSGADTSDIRLLQKPFTGRQLHRAVEETLSA